MKVLQNLHTHTNLCDGADSPEEMILAALEKGFTSLGFSAHAYMPYSPTLAKKGDRTEVYKKEIFSLKEKYKQQIQIYCGLEFDWHSPVSLEGFDYLIGSLHYMDFGGQILGFDRGLEETLNYVKTHFGSDGLLFAKRYYAELCRLPEKADFDILGHFDLITKNNEAGHFIDTSSKEYLHTGFETIHALKGKIPLFEVNTGAIARGYRTAPYPQMEFLKEFQACGYGAVITSDCHNKAYLDVFFKEAAQLLQQAGFRSKWILTDSGFREVGL